MVREAELCAAGEVLGVSRIRLLRFRDSGMNGDLQPGTLAAADFGEVVSTLRTVLPALMIGGYTPANGIRRPAKIRPRGRRSGAWNFCGSVPESPISTRK